ncbi:MAG: type II secretion system secretin GspD [Labilithrix sp.]|nr:type II secretion system secretin GspD [Labilithrix sp.]
MRNARVDPPVSGSMRLRFACALLVALSALSIARRTTAAPDSPFAHAPKPPSDKVALQLEDAELGELVRVIGELTGKRFVIASPKLAKTKASVYAPQKVTVAEAYQAFLAVLAANGLTVVPQAGFLKIVESQDIARQLTPIERGELPREERYVTRIHRLAHLSAEQVSQDVLGKLATKDASIVPYPAGNLLIITETAANLRRMLEVLDAIDAAGEEDKLWLQPLRNVPSSQVEKQLSQIMGLDKEKKADAPAGPLHVGRLVALERPNALVIVATRGSYERILSLLEQIDVAPSSEAQVRVVSLQHADAKKIVGPINEAIGGGAAGGGITAASGGTKTATANAPAAVLEAMAKVSADETTNSLIVTATPRDFVPIKAVIDALDRPKRQVFIEAVVLDVSADRGLDLGVAWHGGFPTPAAFGPGDQTNYGGFRPLASAGTPSSTELQAFALGVRGPEIPFLKSSNVPGLSTIPSFGALLSAIAVSKSADIVSTPHILASDNTAAEIKVQLQTSLQPNAPQTTFFPGQIPGLPPNPTQNSGGAVASNFRGIGPRIKVTPHLNDSNEVRLDIEEMISDIQSTPDKGDQFGTISYLERTANTTLTVKDAETVVIGGLVRTRLSRSETKVPVLGDIPLIGALFRTRNDRHEKSNLILVLTPYIIRDQQDLRRIFERKMQERQELIDRDSIFSGQHEWKAPHDWKRARGLLADIRLKHRDVEVRREEAAAAPQKEPEGVVARPPLEMPVPQAPSGAARPAAAPPPSNGAGAARPTVIER